jgi:hypothetical protein
MARAWAALTALIALREEAIEADDDDALAAIDPRLKTAIERATKALAMPRKIKARQTHYLADYVHELAVVSTLILLMQEHGTEPPQSLLDSVQPLKDVIKQFALS